MSLLFLVENYSYFSSDLPGSSEIPKYILSQSYPNPFYLNKTHKRAGITIKYQIKAKNVSSAQINIFNIKGQLVKTLVSSFKEQGSHSVVWNGNDDSGKTVGSGIFFYKIKTANEIAVSKLLMLK